MHYRRSGAGCAVMNETIYVCGGYGGAIRQGPQHLDSVECFNTLTQQWSFITSMQEPRCYIGACQMDNMIWVAAGLVSINYDTISNFLKSILLTFFTILDVKINCLSLRNMHKEK